MDLTKLELGTCDLRIGGTAAANSVGALLGDVTVDIKEEYSELHAAQFGKTPVDFIRAGKVIEITAELAETTLQNFARAIGGVVSTSAGKNQVQILNAVGESLLAGAQPVRIVKWKNGAPSSIAEDQLDFPSCMVMGMTKIVFGDKQRTYEIKLRPAPNSSTGLFGKVGDPTF